MLRRQQIKRVAFAAFLMISALGARCEAPKPIPPDKNRPPETMLTSAPDSSDVTYFRVHLFWSGFDPDGTVSDWQFAVDDTIIRPDAVVVGTGWIRTTKTDSVFIFSASENGTDQTRDHRFFVSSIDNEGKPDPTPSVIDFTARTICYPVPAVVEGPGEAETLDVFSDVRLCWGGSDCDGEILKMSYRLAPLEIGFRTVPLDEQNCASYENLPSNRSRESYRFLLIAEDDAGSRNLTPVERRFVVNHDPNTEITRFFSIHASGDPLLANLAISTGDTLADSSRVTFSWNAEDIDGAIKGSFWQIDGLNFFADTSLANQADVREATVRWLTSDRGGARLIVGTIDEYGRAEGSPDTIAFFVNFPPTVTITKPVLSPVLSPNNALVVGWRGLDPDGPRSALEYDVQLTREGGSTITRTVEAGQPDSLTFAGVTTGSYTITVTPVDRRGFGKLGAPIQRTVLVLTGSDAVASPLLREEEMK
ncbi:MAG: hypothetical protein ACKVU1_02140 [bacterium]